MVLADTSEGDIGWKKWIVAGWAFMECLLFAGLLYGWASINFVLKAEGIYADLCEDTSNNSLLTYSVNNSEPETVNVVLLNVTTPSSNIVSTAASNMSAQALKKVACKPQDNKMALCFTIGTAMFCIGCAVLGHVNFKFGTRVTRLISL